MNDIDTSWIFPIESKPAPCPRCGRQPRVVQDSHMTQLECRGWHGLWPHVSGPIVFDGYMDEPYATNGAARAWNSAINAAVYPQPERARP